MKHRLGKKAKDALTATGTHHEDHADAGETDEHADDDIRDEDARRLGAKDDRSSCEQQ